MFLLWCDRLIFISLCLLVFMLPVSIAGVSIFSATTIFFYASSKIAASILAASRGGRWWQGLCARTPEPRLLLPLAFFILINFLAVLWSQYPHLSQKAFFSKVLGHVFIYLAAQEAVSSPRRLRVFIHVFLAASVIVCLDALLQLWCGHDLLRHRLLIEGRVSAAFRHPNGLGAYLILALSLFYGRIVLAWPGCCKSRQGFGLAVFFSAGMILAIIVMALTYSRGAWMGLLVAAAAFLLLCRRRAGIWFMVIVCLFLFVFAPMMKLHRHVSLVTEDAAPAAALQTDVKTLESPDAIDKAYVHLVRSGISGSDRMIYWRDAAKIIRDNPWTGTGLNTYAMVVKNYSTYRAYYPHNGYLQLTAELGLFGLVIFLWFLVAHLSHAVRLSRTLGAETGFLWSAVLAGFIGFLVHGFFDTIFYSVQHGALLWIFFGIVAGGRALGGKTE